MIKTTLTPRPPKAALAPLIGEIGVVTSGLYDGCPIIHGYDKGLDVWVILTTDGTHTTQSFVAPYDCRTLVKGESLTIVVTP